MFLSITSNLNKTALIAVLLASVSRMNSLVKSGYTRMGVVISLIHKVVNVCYIQGST